MRYSSFILLFLFLTIPVVAFGADEPMKFVPLTAIPGIEQAGNSATLSLFLNNLYKLCIGAAAILAVLQIIRAGVVYMGGDSITEKKEAKQLITLAIGGLILVLSPVVVFSIINPKILDLKIGGLDQLKPQETSTELLWNSTTLSRSAANTKCTADGGTFSYVCTSTGTPRTPAAGQSCKAGETPLSSCTKAVTAATASGSKCEDYHRTIAPSGASCSVLVSDDYSKVDDVCCGGLTTGNQCCGKPKVAAEPLPPLVDTTTTITARKYAYIAGLADPEDLGPVPASKTAYDAFATACTQKQYVVKNTYGTPGACSASEIEAKKGDARIGYIKCVDSTVSCKAP